MTFYRSDCCSLIKYKLSLFQLPNSLCLVFSVAFIYSNLILSKISSAHKLKDSPALSKFYVVNATSIKHHHMKLPLVGWDLSANAIPFSILVSLLSSV